MSVDVGDVLGYIEVAAAIADHNGTNDVVLDLPKATARQVVEWARLGNAWAEVEAALPEGYTVALLTKSSTTEWMASAYDGKSRWADGFGPTPTAALEALAKAVRERAA